MPSIRLLLLSTGPCGPSARGDVSHSAPAALLLLNSVSICAASVSKTCGVFISFAPRLLAASRSIQLLPLAHCLPAGQEHREAVILGKSSNKVCNRTRL